jgi:DNA-binding transcriptional LysR family regulator
MDFRHFRYFIAAAEELHFARAADRLGIAQPAMSQQIAALESQLAVQLFNRTKKRVELTEAGAAFLVEAKATIASVERAIGVAKETARGELGKVVLGFVGSAMFRPALPQVLKEFTGKHPGVQLDMQEMLPLHQIEAIIAQHSDIGILRGLPPRSLPEGLTSFVLARHQLLVVLPSSHRLATHKAINIADLSQEPWLALDDLTRISLAPELVRICNLAGFDPMIRLHLREIATLVHLVGAGHGVALIPDVAMAQNLKDVVFAPMLDFESHSDLVVVHRKFERSAAVKSLLAQIRKTHAY